MSITPTAIRRSARLQGASAPPPDMSATLTVRPSTTSATTPASASNDKGKSRDPDGGADPDGDPDDGDDAGNDGGDDDDNADDNEDPDIAGALNNLARSLRRMDRASSGPPRAERVKANEPDTFDGSDPKKLKEWLFQCRLYFSTNPSQFPSDRTKISFAITYLRDTALGWFQTVLEEEDLDFSMLEILNDWSEFSTELRARFGTLDAQGEAAEEMEALHMQSNQTILKYDLEFMRLASVLDWNESALCRRYYLGLPDRIHEFMSRLPDGKPKTLIAMKSAANIADQRHWERSREKKRTEGPSHRSTDNSNKSSNRDGNKGNSSGNSSGKPNSSGNKFNPKPSSSANPSSNKSGGPKNTSSYKPNLDGKLGKNGKLTFQERQRRMDNDLCLFCGGSGHKVNECPRKNSPSETSGSTPASGSKAKGRKAQAEAKSSEK
jgi:hypothetical protein